MMKILKSDTVDVSQLSNAEQTVLGDRLYDVHTKVFKGVTKERFVTHVITPPAEVTKIRQYYGQENQLAGYCAAHSYRRQIKGRKAIVLRAEAGLRPEYRGRGSTYWFGMVHAAAEKLRHPFMPVYYLGTLVHTSSYHLFCKYFPIVYPHPEKNYEAKLHDIAIELIDSFDDPAVDESDPMVREVGWITIESPQEESLGKFNDYPDIRFFKERNPGYRQGHGLVVVVPMTFSNLLSAIYNRIVEVARIKFGRLRPHL